MYNKQRYIANGEVARSNIAYDIKERKLSHKDLEDLLKEEEVKKAFFGGDTTKKQSPKNWDEKYLNKLWGYVIAEEFTRDYLLHLEEVAIYVAKRKYTNNVKKMILICVLVFLLIMIAIGVAIVMLSGTDNGVGM